MNIVKPAIACAAVVAAGGLLATAASAADLPLLPEPPPPVAVEAFGGWYLRGDIGVSSQKIDDLEYRPVPAGTTVEMLDHGFTSAGIFVVGAGYKFNNWFRLDITGEYRAPSRFSALDRYDTGSDGTWNGTNEYHLVKTEYVGLLNAYLDLGTWYGVTPFVGAGVGVAHVMLDDFRDVNVPNLGVAYAPDTSTTNFAWALYAGLGYEVNDRLSLELAYRYLNMGDAEAGNLATYTGVNTIADTTTLGNLHSHDVKLGMRWNLQGPGPVYGGPISRSF
jgi:opacity protein-like surface antigen